MPQLPDNWFWIATGMAERLGAAGALAALVYVVLAEHVNEDRACWPSIGRIAGMCRSTKRSVRRALGALESAGLISVTASAADSGATRPHVYTLTPLDPGDKIAPLVLSCPGEGDKRAPPRGSILSRGGRTGSTPELDKERTRTKRTKPKELKGVVTIPENLDVPEFKVAWGEWLAYRKGRRLTMTATALNRQLANLAKLTPAEAVDEIQNSLDHNWQSVCYKGKPNGRKDTKLSRIHTGETIADRHWKGHDTNATAAKSDTSKGS